jgi:hypothetical protein
VKGDRHDPKALIREAFNIEGITESQCRSIFFDWALSLPVDEDTQASLQILLDRHSVGKDDHPMTIVLKDGQKEFSRPKRRGGWRSRPRD